VYVLYRERCYFYFKIHQNAFDGRTPPLSTEAAYSAPGLKGREEETAIYICSKMSVTRNKRHIVSVYHDSVGTRVSRDITNTISKIVLL